MADGDPPSLPDPHLEDGALRLALPVKASDSSTYTTDIVSGQKSKTNPLILNLRPLSLHLGAPSVVFKSVEKLSLLDNLPFVLVGKFSHGRPALSSIKAFFAKLKLQGTYNLSLFDNKHLFIECKLKTDFYIIWLKLVWLIQGKRMRIFKWTPEFSPFRESPLAPVWVRFEGIPLFLFDESVLLSISNSIGRPIKVHHHNINRVWLHSALVCVELDISKPLVECIYVVFQDEESGVLTDVYKVQVFYDVLPSYCSDCHHLGHGSAACKSSTAVLKGADDVFVKNPQQSIHVDKVFDQMSKPATHCVSLPKPNHSAPSLARKNFEWVKVGRKGSGKSTAASLATAQQTKELIQQSANVSSGTDPSTASTSFIAGQTERQTGQSAPLTEDGHTVAHTVRNDITAVKDVASYGKEQDVVGLDKTADQEQDKEPSQSVADIGTETKCCQVQGSKVPALQQKVQPQNVANAAISLSHSASELDEEPAVNVSEGKNGRADIDPLVVEQVLDSLPPARTSSELAQYEMQYVLCFDKAEAYTDVTQLDEEKFEPKVLDKLPQSSPPSDTRLGNSAWTCTPGVLQVAEQIADLEGGTSTDTINKPLFHTPNFKRAEVPMLLDQNSMDNGIIQRKYQGSDLLTCQQKMDSRGEVKSSVSELYLGNEVHAAEVFDSVTQRNVKADSQGEQISDADPAVKVFNKMSETYYVTDLTPPVGADTDLPGGPHGGEFHTPTLKRVEAPCFLNKSAPFEISQGKYSGSDLIGCKQKLPSGVQDSGIQQKQGHMELGPSQDKKSPQKQQAYHFHTDLPIDFDPLMINQETEEKKSWSEIVGGVKLLTRRSISPTGRSSEKLIKLRKRVDYIEYEAGKTFAMDLDEYLESNKEQFQVKAKDPPTPSRNRRPRRRRGQGRVEDGSGHGPDRGRNRDRR